MADEIRRVRTQAERDADGLAWRAVPRRTVVCQYDAKPHPLDDECVNVADAPIVPPRRRWWHRLTRPNRKDQQPWPLGSNTEPRTAGVAPPPSTSESSSAPGARGP